MAERIVGTSNDGSVTAVVYDHVRPGKEKDFEQWAMGIAEELAEFGGLIGHTTIRASEDVHPEYVTVIRFASDADLRRWEASLQLEEWLKQKEPLILGESTFRSQDGMVTWFTLPGHHLVVPPPQYKMALVASVAIYALLLAVLPVLGLLLDNQPFIAAPIRFTPEFVTSTLFSALILVALMTWVAMPLLTWLTRRWLFPSSS